MSKSGIVSTWTATGPSSGEFRLAMSEDEMDAIREALLDIGAPIPDVPNDPVPLHPDDPQPTEEPET